MTNEKLTGMHARWAHILSEYDFEVKHRPGTKSGDADGLSRNPLPNETDRTDARMDHVPPLGSSLTVSAGLAQHAYAGSQLTSPADIQQTSRNLSNSPFYGTSKDGDLAVAHPLTNAVSRDVWLDLGTLQYLKEKTFSP